MHRAADRSLEALAERQFGVVGRAQALGLGFSEAMVDSRVKSGRLKVLHPRTYAISGSPASWHRDITAACIWSGGVASHRAAARLWDLPLPREARILIEVTTSDLRIVPRCGIVVHHTQRLTEEQYTRVQSIPVTSIERTLLDLGAVLTPRRVAVAVDAALGTGDTTLGDLDYCLFRTARRGRRGCAVLREIVRRRERLTEVPNSPLETLIFELISSSGLPLPEAQFEVHTPDGRFVARPDFVYPEYRLVIEGHSKKWHLGDEAAFRDANRHNDLTALGYRILYVTWADVVHRPGPTLMRIESALREAGWDPTTGPARSESAASH